MALSIVLSSTAQKYFESLDKPTKQRISEKLEKIASDPHNVTHSYPLSGVNKRSSRVGKYRILLDIDEQQVLVSDIGPRGQIYRELEA